MADEYESIAQLIAETQITERQLALALAYRDSSPNDVADAIAENRDDPLVRELATEQQRVLVTRNSRDFGVGRGTARARWHDPNLDTRSQPVRRDRRRRQATARPVDPGAVARPRGRAVILLGAV
jgi:hypothetical protein